MTTARRLGAADWSSTCRHAALWTASSLEYDREFSTESPDTVRAVFYGLGSDGTVGANKNSIKIIGEEINTLVINLDNGPENHSHRTQFLNRLVAFAQTYQLTVKLAYYPPYHSKYNPVERCWGILEQHWNADLLDTIETVVNFAQTMRRKGNPPVVRLLTSIYHTGVRLTKKAMAQVETHVQRLTGLERWFIDIPCTPSPSPDT